MCSRLDNFANTYGSHHNERRKLSYPIRMLLGLMMEQHENTQSTVPVTADIVGSAIRNWSEETQMLYADAIQGGEEM